ncbi:hypothetical protein [Alicyclobacillus macrosporangiidus]|uniref:Uncharacterized protein n=1 Tax=Alicyclobacillus macrosporangiidus TaxID=392015 RepID=A0A1I7LJH3_9BACL|nr:hypothetical protein [Alicyclobacillus macrosporangiidus]SFV09846.1 hypothetical protein SAMN05421543_1671 [Alicyclobacillus macrosporangiidus]
MTFEEKLRNEIKDLPVRGLTNDKQQAVLEQIRKTDRTRHPLRGLSSAVAAVGAVAIILVGTTIMNRNAQYRSPLSLWTTATVENSVLNTPSFRNAVQAYLETHTDSGFSSAAIPSAVANNPEVTNAVPSQPIPTTIKDLAVRWSQLDGKFGYAFVSFRRGESNHVATVVAQQKPNLEWDVLDVFDSGPLPPAYISKFPVYNMESSRDGTPSYFMVCGILVNPNITRVQITWPDGQKNEAQVANGVYGYVKVYPAQMNSMVGPKNIEAFTPEFDSW